MKYRKLGKTEICISTIGFGCWGIGGNSYGEVDDKESIRALNLAFEKGINFFDTADLYGNGHSETILAHALGYNRKNIVIASKGGTLPHTGFNMPQDFSIKYLKSVFEKSLVRLDTDYIDLYQLHSPMLSDLVNSEEVFAYFAKLKKNGTIRAFGISVRSPEDGLEVLAKYPVDTIQVNYNMIDQRASECGLFREVLEKDVGIIIRTPLVFGFLTGTLTGGEKFKKGIDHRANWPKEQLKRWASAYILFDNLARKRNITSVQLALLFCLSECTASSVIPGMLNTQQVNENAVAGDMSVLSKKELTIIREIYNNNIFYDNHSKLKGILQ
jgi:aryl-alcohol dehydrogenase-like predicted oxidoreductase